MADPNHDRDGAPPREVHVGPAEDKTNWIAWLALAAGILALLFALSRCDKNDATVIADPTPTASETMAPISETTTTRTTTMVGTSGLGAYIGGTGALPQSFQFERLNFDTGASTVRPADREEIAAVTNTLKQYGNTRVRVVGYADARGPGDANAALGKARADAVKAALVDGGIPDNRVDTASGGEADPVNTNTAAGGQAENRRTEIVLLQR